VKQPFYGDRLPQWRFNQHKQKNMALGAAGTSLMILICIYILISSCKAKYQDSLTLKFNSSNCSIVVEADGSVAQIEVVRNASMKMFLLSNTFGHIKSLSTGECNKTTLDIQLLDSNMSISLNRNDIHIQAIKLSASMMKFQNGTLFVGSSVLVPESSVIELEHAIVTTTTNYRQLLLTIHGTLIIYESVQLLGIFQ
jgi:hypothetical protein